VVGKAERRARFDPRVALAHSIRLKVAIDPRRWRMRAEGSMPIPRIDVRLEHHVTSVDDANGLEVVLRGHAESSREQFDHVVNALWDGRFAINETRGLRSDRPWLLPLKYGVSSDCREAALASERYLRCPARSERW